MYRAKPITQRDGSSLQNSNCRMASIATGLDFDTLGGKTSSGAKMRGYCDDQQGGTDSGDARTSWQRGYSEGLRVRDGELWSDAVADLEAGRLVHLDVWHKTAGGCVSGSGEYGHTMAVAPEKSGTRWLVADPWCKPARWEWIEAAKLRAGAEEWGRRAGARANVTSGRRWTLEEIARIIRAARDLMTEAHPSEDAPLVEVTVNDVNVVDVGETSGPETAGPQPILFTTTMAHGDAPQPGGDDVRFINANGYTVDSGLRVNVGAGAEWFYLDGTRGGAFGDKASLRVVGRPDANTGRYAVVINTGNPYADKVSRETVVEIHTTNDTYPAPTTPDPEPPDNDARDAEWRAWLLEGSPGDES